MKRTIWILSIALWAVSVISCTTRQQDKASEGDAANTGAAVKDTVDVRMVAIEAYLTDSIGSQYAPGEVCIACPLVVDVDDQNKDDIQVWGSFWVFNYNIAGDTLKTVSGGNHPGLMHLREAADGSCTVVAFDAVGDGSTFEPTAKRIFGDRYEQFMKLNADDQQRESTRTRLIADYVAKHRLPVTMVQDYGWPPVALTVDKP